MRWVVHLDGGPRRVNHAAVSVGGLIFSFGGYCTGDNYRDPQPIDVFVLNTVTYRWSAVPKPKSYEVDHSDWPYQRYGHTVVAWGRNIILFGGRSDHTVCNTIYLFNTETFKWKKFPNRFGANDPRAKIFRCPDESKKFVHGNIPMARDGHSACIIGDSMYIYGGYVEAEHHFCGDIYKLNLMEMCWELLLITSGDVPAYRDFHTATAIGHKIYIFGGRCCPISIHVPNSEFYCNEIRYFDTLTKTWCNPGVVSEDGIKEPVIPEGRRSHSAINFNGNLVIFGGFNSVKSEHMNDLWLFNTNSNSWRKLQPSGKGPGPRRRQAVCRVGNRIFLFGGTSPYHGPKIVFTQLQLELMNELMRDETLVDHSDLYVLDVCPSLKTLCMDVIVNSSSSSQKGDEKEKKKKKAAAIQWWETAELPAGVIQDLKNMTTRNNISMPLKTLASG